MLSDGSAFLAAGGGGADRRVSPRRIATSGGFGAPPAGLGGRIMRRPSQASQPANPTSTGSAHGGRVKRPAPAEGPPVSTHSVGMILDSQLNKWAPPAAAQQPPLADVSTPAVAPHRQPLSASAASVRPHMTPGRQPTGAAAPADAQNPPSGKAVGGGMSPPVNPQGRTGGGSATTATNPTTQPSSSNASGRITPPRRPPRNPLPVIENASGSFVGMYPAGGSAAPSTADAGTGLSEPQVRSSRTASAATPGTRGDTPESAAAPPPSQGRPPSAAVQGLPAPPEVPSIPGVRGHPANGNGNGHGTGAPPRRLSPDPPRTDVSLVGQTQSPPRPENAGGAPSQAAMLGLMPLPEAPWQAPPAGGQDDHPPSLSSSFTNGGGGMPPRGTPQTPALALPAGRKPFSPTHHSYPESQINFQVKYANDPALDAAIVGRQDIPAGGREPWTSPLFRDRPVFPVEGQGNQSYSIDDGGPNPAREKWKSERLEVLERKRAAHRAKQPDVSYSIVNAPGAFPAAPRPAYPSYQQLQYTDPNAPAPASGHEPYAPVFAAPRLGEPDFSEPAAMLALPPPPPPQPMTVIEQHESVARVRPRHETEPVSPTSPGGAAGPSARMLLSGESPSPSRAVPTVQRPSVLEKEMAKDPRTQMDIADNYPGGVMLEDPDDSMPIVPMEQQAAQRLEKYNWVKHLAAPMLLNLFYLRGVDYGVSEQQDALIESYMNKPLLNSLLWMLRGAYVLKFTPQEAHERWVFVKEFTDPRTGLLIPRLCFANKEDSHKYTIGGSLTDLVGVQRGVDAIGWEVHKVPGYQGQWLKGVYIGNRRRFMQSRNCFTLTFRIMPTRAGQEVQYKPLHLMILRDDMYKAWVPAFECLRHLVSQKNLAMPSTAEARRGYLGPGRHRQPPRPVAVKTIASPGERKPYPPGHGVGIKQPPPSAAATARDGGTKRRALIIGVGYEGASRVPEELKLRRAPAAASNVANFLLRRREWTHGCDIRILKDTSENAPESGAYPSRANIINAIKWLTSEPDATLFLFYCGHAGGMLQTNAAVVPADFAQAGTITPPELRGLLMDTLMPNCRLTCIFDVPGGDANPLNLPAGLVHDGSSLRVRASSAPPGHHPVVTLAVEEDVGAWTRAHVGAVAAAFTATLARHYLMTVAALLEGMQGCLKRNDRRCRLHVSGSHPVEEGALFPC